MGTLTRDCPHCHATNVAFNSFAEYCNPNRNTLFLTAFECGACHGGYFANFVHQSGSTPHNYKGNTEKSDGLRLFEEYPQAQSNEAPQYLPVNIQSFFEQATSSLKANNLDASAMMSRKVLEVAVKTLNPQGKGKLYKRIEQLFEKGKITQELKDWAHIIRDDGNEAAHEEEPVTLEFADELISFAELFLMYTFTMPGMVKAKKGKSEEENA